MTTVRDEAVAAYELLTPDLRKLIGPDAVAVLQTAIEHRTGDPLVDGSIDYALQHHGIDKRSKTEQVAYRRFLVGHFALGRGAREQHAQRHGSEMRGGAA